MDVVVIGADELPLDEESLLDESIRQRAAEGQLEIISETQLWQRLGMFEEEANCPAVHAGDVGRAPVGSHLDHSSLAPPQADRAGA